MAQAPTKVVLLRRGSGGREVRRKVSRGGVRRRGSEGGVRSGVQGGRFRREGVGGEEESGFGSRFTLKQ